jgi:legumain
MFAQKMYKQLTFYLETCESGSMFQNILPNNMSIYALSAANPSESSWATYCPPQDQVNGKHIGSCLGDEFSVNWMENTIANNPTAYTLQEQFAAVKTLTLGSEVMQWGDLTFTSEPIGVFQGNSQGSNKMLKKVMGFFRGFQGDMNKISQDQRDVEVNYLLSQFNSDVTDDDVYEKLVWELTTTRRYSKIFKKFTAKYQISGIYFGSTDFECYESLIGKVQAQCGKLNDQATRHLKYLYQYCASYSEWQNAEFEC